MTYTSKAMIITQLVLVNGDTPLLMLMLMSATEWNQLLKCNDSGGVENQVTLASTNIMC